MAEPLYCALASNSISFGYAGGSRPCCAVDTHFWRERKHQLSDYPGDLIGWFNNEELVKVRKDLLEGKWNPVCNLCKTREQHGQASTRQIFNNTLTDWEEKLGKNLRESSPVSNDLSNIFLLAVSVSSLPNAVNVQSRNRTSSSNIAANLSRSRSVHAQKYSLQSFFKSIIAEQTPVVV